MGKARGGEDALPDRIVRVTGGSQISYGGGVSKHSTNNVISSSYTLWNFLPFNLILQFSNMSNLYFLFVGALQIIPAITTTDGNPTMYQPLAFIVMVSAIRAASEDYQKHKADAKRNGYLYEVLQGDGSFQKTKSGHLVVGNVIKVMENDMIPSDCVFLGSALPKGHCFIDKANLNGETKLEVMSCHPATKAYCDKPEKMSKMNFELVYEAPNKRFDSLRGMIKIDGQEVAVDGKSLLMRETNLKNCAFIYGLVVYTGNDTKIQVSNSEGEKAKVKVSWIMRQVNVYLRYMLLLQLVLCAGGAVGAATWAKANKGAWYLDLGDEDIDLLGFYAFFTWFILLSQMVPISLIVSAEMVKFVMSMFIQWDYTLYYPDINKPTKCNSSTIHEDLGLIDYIFSDKTGTLTQNKMEFRYLMLNCGDWGSKETEIAKSVQRRKAELESGNEPAPATPWTTLSAPLHADSDSPYRGDRCERSCLKGLWADDPPKRDVELDDAAANKFSNRERTELLLALWGPPGEGESLAANKKKKKMLKTYMRHCALSNTVKSYMDEGVLKFQAESAEELAMVQFAESIGFVKARSNPTVLEIQTYKPSMEKSEVITEKYAHVATFGFTSKRARVTVVLQNQESGTYMVLHKGQDTVVLPLTTNDDGNDDLLTIELSSLSTNGLRTLVCGHADHPTGWWDQYSKQYHRAVKMEVTPASEGHSDNKCTPVECVHCVQHDLFQKIEQEADLKFLGVVGMEDQLQLLVPEAIKDFLRAGIRVWMITGDKLETAKNIGLACNLIDPDMSPQVRVGDTLEEVASAFSNARLIEVTGAWSGLVNSRSELTRLFDSLDHNEDGSVDTSELVPCLTALKCNVSKADMGTMFNGRSAVSLEDFMEAFKSRAVSMAEAVEADIDHGFTVYNRIEEHEKFPISILVNRGAFQTMFPGKSGPPAGVTMEQLERTREKFFNLAAISKSVVFARAQPAMKKKMVTEIQTRVPSALTLAIGDGANDTDMIMAAHIGVGIAGVEGTAATNSADYAIGTFRMLHTLLFKHGLWSYIRVSKLVHFIFYKASLLAASMYIFAPYSGYSGQQLFNDPPYQLYNVSYTALPVMTVAILDKILSGDDAENNPIVYRTTRGSVFTGRKFIMWIVRAFVHVVILFVIPSQALHSKADFGLWSISIVIFECVALVPSLLILFLMENISFLHILSIVMSITALFVFNLALGHWLSYNPDLYGVMEQIYGDGYVWLVVLLTVSVPLLAELAFRGMMVQNTPTLGHVLKEKAYLKKVESKGETDTVSDFHAGGGLITALQEKCVVQWKSLAKENQATEMKVKSFLHRMSVREIKTKTDTNGVFNTILRFRKLTGSQFDSAAQAQYQVHDDFMQLNGENVRGVRAVSTDSKSNEISKSMSKAMASSLHSASGAPIQMQDVDSDDDIDIQ